VFESEFLTSADQSKKAYIRLISRAAEILCQFFPNQPYSGASARSLTDLIPSDFLPGEQRSSEQIAEILKVVASNSVAVSHPATAAHLHCPPLLAALAAEVVISALNQSMDSFDQAPVASIIEQKLLRWLCQEIGLPPIADGTFTTGGSQSNYMGLLLARDAFLQKTWKWSAQKQGLHPDSRRLRIICSEVAHFTVEKSASQLGLGSDAVVRVGVDDRFRMNPADLRTALESLRAQTLLPMAIVATAGTTDFGSIDPLPEIAATAHETGAWLHVDAAYGGALLFSPQHRSRLAGIEAADSLSIDFHKLFWQPIPCSIFLLRDARNFEHIKMHADYLNPERHEETGIPDLVTTSLLTSRRFDALKLWISFESLGRNKLAEMIERTVALANHAAGLIRRTRHLELMCEPQLSTVVFRVLPSSADIDADRLNTAVRQRLFDSGHAVIGHCRARNHQCLKFTCMNPTVTEAEMEALIQKILKVASDLT
jgi:L-2,4-diaminobutyrate decarboxylase